MYVLNNSTELLLGNHSRFKRTKIYNSSRATSVRFCCVARENPKNVFVVDVCNLCERRNNFVNIRCLVEQRWPAYRTTP